MMIERGMIERYLDGECSAAEVAALEAAAEGDAAVAAMIAGERSARQARAALFAAYAPTAEEARAAAEAVMAAAHAPLGRVGMGRWVRRLSAVAAAAAIVAGAFVAGRATAPTTGGSAGDNPQSVATVSLPDHPYVVVYWNNLGELASRQFANVADVDAFVAEMQSRGAGEIASISPDETASLGDSGSF